jgi:hypothetical protein
MNKAARFAPLTGVVYVVLYVVGSVLGLADSPDFPASERKTLAYYVEHKSDVIAGGVVVMIGVVFLLWFLGSVRRACVAGEGGDGRISSIGFAGGAIGVGSFLAGAVALILPAVRLDEVGKLSPEFATAMYDLSGGLVGVAAAMGFAVLLLSVAVLGIRGDVVPTWWAWISAVIGVVMLIPWISWAGMFIALPLWVLVMVVILMRAGAREGAAMAAP